MPSLRAHNSTRTLQLESLETRFALAGITATLGKTGELVIAGTAGNDQIVVHQMNNKLTINGVKGTFDSTKIKQITVNSLGGNDTVTFKGFVGPTVPWSKPLNVNNSGGTDTVNTFDGATVSLPSGSKFSRTQAGVNTVNGKAVDWFDLNIRDAALRSLLKTDYADKVVNRAEMLQIFSQVASDGVVSANEFSDLKAVANNTSLFTNVEYVGVLTRDVALGNVANATYQGTTLGNLTSGANATHLNKLVNKWFLGLDRPAAAYNSTTFAYANASGSLFGGSGPVYSDVRQGVVGDCYFLGALGETSLRTPSAISNMFIVNGDGTYTVRFYNGGTADYVTVDSKLPVDQAGRLVFANMGQYANNSGNVLWVAMAEKAYAQINEAGWLRRGLPGNGANSYQAVAGGYFSHAVAQIANKSSTSSYMAGSTFSTFTTAFNAGKLIGFASTSTPANSSIVGGHQYVAVSYDANAQTVTMYNPWGVNNGSSYPGLVTMSWSSLASSFSYWDRA